MAKHNIMVEATTTGSPAVFINNERLDLQSGDGEHYRGSRNVDAGNLRVEFQCRGLNGTKWAFKATVDDAEKPSCEKSGMISHDQFDSHTCTINLLSV